MIAKLSQPLLHYERRYLSLLYHKLEKKDYGYWKKLLCESALHEDSTLHFDRVLWGRDIQIEICFVEVTDEYILVWLSVDLMPSSEDRSPSECSAWSAKRSSSTNLFIHKGTAGE